MFYFLGVPLLFSSDSFFSELMASDGMRSVGGLQVASGWLVQTPFRLFVLASGWLTSLLLALFVILGFHMTSPKFKLRNYRFF